MFKKLIAILLLLATLVSAVACDTGAGDPSGDGETGDETPETAVIKLDKILYSNDAPDGFDYRTLINKYQKLSGIRLSVQPESVYEGEDVGLLVIGNTARSISKKATSRMNLYRNSHRLDEFELTYAIYSKGGNVAVVWAL